MRQRGLHAKDTFFQMCGYLCVCVCVCVCVFIPQLLLL